MDDAPVSQSIIGRREFRGQTNDDEAPVQVIVNGQEEEVVLEDVFALRNIVTK